MLGMPPRHGFSEQTLLAVPPPPPITRVETEAHEQKNEPDPHQRLPERVVLRAPRPPARLLTIRAEALLLFL